MTSYTPNSPVASNLHKILTNKYSKASGWMQKMGWTPGEGLGKTSQGPVDFVKVGVKKDTAGLGTNKDQFEKWWEKVYNETAKNIGEDAPKPKPEPKVVYGGSFISKNSESSESEEEGDMERAIYKEMGERGFSQSASIKPTGKLNRLKNQDAQYQKQRVAPEEDKKDSKKEKKRKETSNNEENEPKDKKKKKLNKEETPLEESEQTIDSEKKKKKKKKQKNHNEIK